MLTRIGWLVMSVAVAAGAAWAVWGRVHLASIAVIAAVALVPGLVWRTLRLAPYTVELDPASTTVHRGDDVPLSVGVRRAGRGMMPTVRVALTAFGASAVRSLRPGAEVWAIRAARRGRQTIAVAGLTCRDPLGLWWRRADVPARDAGARIISVLPRFVPMAHERVADSPASGRPSVHFGSLAVLLDVHRHPFEPADGRDDPFELAVDLAFSLAGSATAEGIKVSLFTNADGQVSCHDDPGSITDVLTSVPACGAYPGCAAAASLRAMVQQRYERDPAGPTVIVSTGNDAASVVAPLADERRPDDLVLMRVVAAQARGTTVGQRGGLRVIEVADLVGAARHWTEQLAH